MLKLATFPIRLALALAIFATVAVGFVMLPIMLMIEAVTRPPVRRLPAREASGRSPINVRI